MPITLATTLGKIKEVQSPVNAELIEQYFHYLKGNATSESHQINCVKDITNFAKFLKPEQSLYDLKGKEGKALVIKYLDSKIKSIEEDPDQRWITSWNDYLGRLKHFFRWLYNYKLKESSGKILPIELWKTPEFVQIPKRKTKRQSPYSVNQLWELDELLTIIKYEPNPRNRAAIAMQWDFNGRNKEVCMIKMKHIRFYERYAEGEIPYNTKTGGGSFLLRASFPYVLAWYNQHPFKDNPEAYFIINQMTGDNIKPSSLWRVMDVLRQRIETLVKNGKIENKEERQRLEHFLRTKKWNPYCFRHSSITADSDYLPEFALRKKVRWSMNSKQPARYIKARMGERLKKEILAHDGILVEDEIKPKPKVLYCPKCHNPNSQENKFCSNPQCTYPLTQTGYNEISFIKQIEDMKQRQTELESQLRKATMMLSLHKSKPIRKSNLQQEQNIKEVVEAILARKGIK